MLSKLIKIIIIYTDTFIYNYIYIHAPINF